MRMEPEGIYHSSLVLYRLTGSIEKYVQKNKLTSNSAEDLILEVVAAVPVRGNLDRSWLSQRKNFLRGIKGEDIGDAPLRAPGLA